MILATINDKATFDSAFGVARSSGADLFDWRGNRYTTIRLDDPIEPIPILIGLRDISQDQGKERLCRATLC